jgi:peptide/nickel transport system permease protein
MLASDPMATAPEEQFAAPSLSHPLGTDQHGRDILSRTVWGMRRTFSLALLAAAIAAASGLAGGGLAGSLGGYADWVLMRGMDILLAFPGLLMALAVVGLLGAGPWQSAVAVGVSLTALSSRIARAAVLSVRSSEYIEAARAVGAGPLWIIRRHILPSLAGQLASLGSLLYAWSLLNLAALEFLGLGGSPSDPSLGGLLSDGRTYLASSAWIAVPSGIILTLCVMAIMGLGGEWQRHRDPLWKV